MDESPKVWPPPIKRQPEQRPATFVKWRRRVDWAGVASLGCWIVTLVAWILGVAGVFGPFGQPILVGLLAVSSMLLWLVGIVLGLFAHRSTVGRVGAALSGVFLGLMLIVLWHGSQMP